MTDTKTFSGLPLFDSAKHFNQTPRSEIFPAQSPAVELFVRSVDVAGALDDRQDA